MKAIVKGLQHCDALSAPRRPLRSATPFPLRDALSTPSPLRRQLRDEYKTSGTVLSTSTRIRERPGSIVVTTVGSTNHKPPSETRKKCHPQELAPRRSKKSSGKARKATTTPEESTPAAPGNSFAALAPTDQGGPAKTDEEERNAADDARALGATPDIAATTTPAPSAGDVEEGSSLAEDILAAPSTLPANDPVRVETAAYRRKCMLDGTTPPAWVLELVLPGSRKTVSGPSDKQIAKVRGVQAPQQNLDVVFERVQNPPTPAAPIQQQSSSSDSSRTSPPDQSRPAPLKARTTSAVEALPTARATSAVAPPSSHHHHSEHGKSSTQKSDLPPSLKLHNLPAVDVPEIMALFHSRIRLHAPDGTHDSVIGHQAMRYLAHLVTGGAASTMHQVQCEALEWRTDKEHRM